MDQVVLAARVDQAGLVDQAGRVVSADPVGQVVLVGRVAQDDVTELAYSEWQ